MQMMVVVMMVMAPMMAMAVMTKMRHSIGCGFVRAAIGFVFIFLCQGRSRRRRGNDHCDDRKEDALVHGVVEFLQTAD
jgi:hypothetical protein